MSVVQPDRFRAFQAQTNTNLTLDNNHFLDVLRGLDPGDQHFVIGCDLNVLFRHIQLPNGVVPIEDANDAQSADSPPTQSLKTVSGNTNTYETFATELRRHVKSYWGRALDRYNSGVADDQVTYPILSPNVTITKRFMDVIDVLFNPNEKLQVDSGNQTERALSPLKVRHFLERTEGNFGHPTVFDKAFDSTQMEQIITNAVSAGQYRESDSKTFTGYLQFDVGALIGVNILLRTQGTNSMLINYQIQHVPHAHVRQVITPPQPNFSLGYYALPADVTESDIVGFSDQTATVRYNNAEGKTIASFDVLPKDETFFVVYRHFVDLSDGGSNSIDSIPVPFQIPSA